MPKDKLEEKREEKSFFKIDITPEIPPLPDYANKEKIDVRYPLISPYAYAHIYYDKDLREILYKIEEPELSDRENNILNLLEEGIKELINLSFISVKEKNEIIIYLEKNVRVLLNEMSISIESDSFLKLMYYIYRDFVGLNEAEPLLNDYYIEDIECNGVDSPIYVVHRKYRNLKTTLTYKDLNSLISFVEKLAQKCGKYISYANPLLDGALPDGSRVNATYTQEISSKGPSYTIRKFTKEPWSPIQMIEKGTLSPEILAYIWLLIEYEKNVMIIGGTGSGKTTLINTFAFFIPPQARIVSIEDSVLGDTKIIIKKGEKISIIKIEDFVSDEGMEILTLDKNYKIKFVKPKSFIKHKTNKDIYEIITSSGRRIRVTKDHSIFTLGENGLKETKPTDLIKNKSFVAVPRSLPFDCCDIKKINLLDHLDKLKRHFICGEPIKEIFKNYKYKNLNINKNTYQWWKKHNIIPIKTFIGLNYKFKNNELNKLYIKTKNTTKLPVLFNISDEFLQFIGLWLGDGSYDNFNKNRVIISNNDGECINLVKKISKDLDLNISKMNDDCSLTVNSSLLYDFMKYVLNLDGYSNTKKIPEFVLNLSNRQIKEFIKGYFSADGTVKKYEVCCCSQSRELLEVLQTLFLRLNIISRIHPIRKDKCMELSISSYENVNKIKDIKFLQDRKNLKLQNICNKKALHASSDIIPLSTKDLYEINKFKQLKSNYLNNIWHIGRNYLNEITGMFLDKDGQILPRNINFIKNISNSDILWDKIVFVKKLDKKERLVYDFSVDNYEKFIGENIILHNTRELQLYHENWLPSVSRAGIGLASLSGQKQGEVSLFDLLKESFRQRPDYIIVGEIRGVEAYVLFQGMASGHPAMGTMHAEDARTMIRRLETPPINLSPALVESMDAVCVMSQTKVKGNNVRRLSQIEEIVEVREGIGGEKTNVVFLWDPRTDKFYFKSLSKVFEKIMVHYGINKEKLYNEFKLRTLLLMEMYKQRIFDFKEVQRIINEYYKNPEATLKRFKII